MNLQRNDDINLDEGKQCTKITPVVTDASEGSLEESPSIPLIAGTVSKKKQASCCLIGLSLRRRLLFVLFWDYPTTKSDVCIDISFCCSEDIYYCTKIHE